MALLQLCKAVMRRHRLRQAAKDPVGVVARRARAPIQSKSTRIVGQTDQLERSRTALEAQLADCAKRHQAAEEHERRQRSEFARLHVLVSKLCGEKESLEAQRDSKGKYYVDMAQKMGWEGATAWLLGVRESPSLKAVSAPGSMQQEYARLHFQIREKDDQIKDARANAARAEQTAAEQRQLKEDEASRQSQVRLELEEVLQRLQKCQKAQEDLVKQQTLSEEVIAEWRRTLMWAKSISPPPLIQLSIANLGSLLMQRRHAISAAVAIEDFAQLRQMQCVASELQNFPNVTSQLKRHGFASTEMKSMGFSLEQMKCAAYGVQQLLQADFTPSELKKAGFSAKELVDADVPAQELLRIGFPIDALRKAGWMASKLELELESLSLSISDLQHGGFTPREILEASFTPSELKKAGFSANELIDADVPAQELLRIGYPIDALRKAGCKASELAPIGVSASQLRKGGFSVPEMLDGSFTASQLKHSGFTAKELLRHMSLVEVLFAGFTLDELLQAGCDPDSAKACCEYAAGMPIEKLLRGKGLTESQLKAAGFSADQLRGSVSDLLWPYKRQVVYTSI